MVTKRTLDLLDLVAWTIFFAGRQPKVCLMPSSAAILSDGMLFDRSGGTRYSNLQKSSYEAGYQQ